MPSFPTSNYSQVLPKRHASFPTSNYSHVPEDELELLNSEFSILASAFRPLTLDLDIGLLYASGH